MFFYSGQYKVEIQCSGYDCGGLNFNHNMSSENTQASNYYKQQQQLRADMARSKKPINNDEEKNGPNLWKCLPVIEINVSEALNKPQ